MDLEEFARQIETARWRVAGLERHSIHKLPDPEILASTFEELSVAYEELRVAEEELRHQNESLLTTRERVEAERRRYQELFDFAPDGYLTTTATGTIREANHAAATLLGAPQRSLVGTPLALFVVDYARRAFRHDFQRLRQVDKPQHWEVRMQPQKGSPFDAELTIAPVRDWSGMIGGLRWMLRDITARKQADEQIRTLNGQLEYQVRERTAQLEAANAAKEAALVQEQAARAAAEQAVYDREAFMAITAHELKAPLAAIIGYAQLLQRRIMAGDTLKSRDLRGLRTIAESAQQLTTMADLLLDTARAEAGHLAVNRAPIDLVPLARQVTEALRIAFKRHRLELRCADTPVIVYGDEMRLYQVMQNLLQNAIKYSPADSAITLVLESLDDRARLAVSDQGIGIPSDARAHIFERFYRVRNTDSEYDSGIGIGLYLVKEIVELHGGQIEVESAVGAGSTFIVRLPLAQAE